MPDVTNSPLVIYAAIIFGSLAIAAAAIPKILGPLAKAWEDWLAARRRTAAATEDLERLGLRDDNRYLRGIADARRRELEERDVLNSVHIGWDYEVMQKHPDVGRPPPLYPAMRAEQAVPPPVAPIAPASATSADPAPGSTEAG